MLDQLIIGTKASFDDFGASVSKRTIKAPKKKSIKETVPFSNVTYDFSAINGEVYWEERELEYVFEIIADTPADLESKKVAFSAWIMNVMNEKIYDPHDPDFHYIGTFDSLDPDDDESVEKSTITVKFSAYPYKIANKETTYLCAVPASSEKKFRIETESAHRIVPTIITNYPITLIIGDTNYSVPAGTVTDSALMFSALETEIVIRNDATANCNVQIRFLREVF